MVLQWAKHRLQVDIGASPLGLFPPNIHWKAGARPDGSLVKPWNYAAAVKDLAERAGVKPITLHDLRDTHASILAKRGVPLEVVSKRLGHSTIGITAERYLFVYQERDAAAASVFNTLSG